MELNEAVVRVQSAYPQVYLACHSSHQNARTTAAKLSPRDSSLLAHLTETIGVRQADLAKHLGVAKSTLSAALSELEKLGFVARRPGAIFRTPTGTRTMSESSVLESARLQELLGALTKAERVRAVEGLELIAAASRRKRK